MLYNFSIHIDNSSKKIWEHFESENHNLMPTALNCDMAQILPEILY